jgi:hypothetical protein
MSSLRQIISARANGARSRGPVTAAGKARSSQNAIRHGLFAKCVVMSNESSVGFHQWREQFIQRFGPFEGVELAVVEEMVAASWRLRRIWALETGVFDEALAAQPPGNEMARTVAAFRSLAKGPELNLIHRYETRFHTIFQRSLYSLFLLRTPGMQNEPDCAELGETNVELQQIEP